MQLQTYCAFTYKIFFFFCTSIFALFYSIDTLCLFFNYSVMDTIILISMHLFLHYIVSSVSQCIQLHNTQYIHVISRLCDTFFSPIYTRISLHVVVMWVVPECYVVWTWSRGFSIGVYLGFFCFPREHTYRGDFLHYLLF